MGNNNSHYEHQLHEERERSRRQHEEAEGHRRWLESERDRIATERQRELEAERHARAEREKALALQHQEEMKRAQEERDRIQQEKERAVAEQHANELRLLEEQAKKQKEHQQELQREQKERERLQAENHEREMRRIQAEKEEEMRRAEEELKRLEEAHRVQEELRALQEQMRLEEERKKMEELARKTEEEARKRVEKEIYLREEAERNLQEGIPPVKYPTGEEFQLMRQKLGYQEGYLHVAITGFTGCGKSSLINALRGLKSSNSPKEGIAKTGTSETTTEVGRYYDPDPSRQWLAWYDVPGAGTVNIRDWQYFNDQGLYIFDVIIVVAGDRFTQTDIEILFHCKRFGIAAFVVRSKSDQHIGNVMKNDDGDSDSDSDDESDNDERKRKRLLEARGKYIADTRNNFQSLLQQVGLPQQKVYIVCDDALRLLQKNIKTDVIDEEELMRDLTQVAKDKSQSFF
ncbi:interferon-inducible GTPase-domain-containing protein [Morchella snyderi]|nr:interferon-inducible GTPase-domain-containing protein [Morchella snyderi]